jgi:beta-glucosidase/6-phospho-beta-glucosidase/beta-galactosidase
MAAMTGGFIGAFESTYLPAHDLDVLETSGHTVRWRDDLDLLAEIGIRRLRYPIRWHRVEQERGIYDWASTDVVLAYLREQGFEPIVDLVHHTSYPRWLDRGFLDPHFGPAYLEYCAEFAQRYPWVREYTLFNEAFSTLFLSGHEGIWPPYGRGMESFVSILSNVFPSVAEASQLYRDLLPEAKHVYVDTCEGHVGYDEIGRGYAAMANDRRFFLLDLMLGRELDDRQPFVQEVLVAGGEGLLEMRPGHVDVLGLDYYAHSEWCFSERGGLAPSRDPQGLAALAQQYHEHFDLPMMLTETNIRGFAPDRVSWLKYTLEQYEMASESGIPLNGYCWFPSIDSVDWDSLLANADGHVDPVGVFWLDEELKRRTSSMSEWFTKVVAGCSSADIPAYRFQAPLDRWLQGFIARLDHWDWEDPPSEEIGMCANTRTIHANWEVLDDFVW